VGIPQGEIIIGDVVPDFDLDFDCDFDPDFDPDFDSDLDGYPNEGKPGVAGDLDRAPGRRG